VESRSSVCYVVLLGSRQLRTELDFRLSVTGGNLCVFDFSPCHRLTPGEYYHGMNSSSRLGRDIQY
jgi:hypothetical protein